MCRYEEIMTDYTPVMERIVHHLQLTDRFGIEAVMKVAA